MLKLQPYGTINYIISIIILSIILFFLLLLLWSSSLSSLDRLFPPVQSPVSHFSADACLSSHTFCRLLKTPFLAGLQFHQVAHTSASDLASGWHCAV